MNAKNLRFFSTGSFGQTNQKVVFEWKGLQFDEKRVKGSNSNLQFFKEKCLLSLYEPTNLKEFAVRQEAPHEESEMFLNYFKN